MNVQLNQTAKTKILALCVALMLGAPATMASEIGGMSSLRTQDLSVEKPAEALKKQTIEDGVMNRDFVMQPPLVPHKIRGYQIDKNVNKCLSCHSWKNAKEWGATRISVTHFYDRDGKQLADVAPGRYFCLQCHVPQADAKPIIENKFKPVDALNKQP